MTPWRWIVPALALAALGVTLWLQFGGALKGIDLGRVEEGVKELLDEKAVKDEAIRGLSQEIGKLRQEADAHRARALAERAARLAAEQRAAELLGQVGRLEAERRARPAIRSLEEGRDELANRLR